MSKEMTGDDLLTLLETPAPIWLVIGINGLPTAIVQGNDWMLVYDRGRQPSWRGTITCRPMPGRYTDRQNGTVVVVAEDGTWTTETISDD